MLGTIAVTDQGWYEFLLERPDLDEVNFWCPSARRRFVAPEFSPFLFKLRSPHNAICGFGFFSLHRTSLHRTMFQCLELLQPVIPLTEIRMGVGAHGRGVVEKDGRGRYC